MSDLSNQDQTNWHEGRFQLLASIVYGIEAKIHHCQKDQHLFFYRINLVKCQSIVQIEVSYPDLEVTP